MVEGEENNRMMNPMKLTQELAEQFKAEEDEPSPYRYVDLEKTAVLEQTRMFHDP